MRGPGGPRSEAIMDNHATNDSSTAVQPEVSGNGNLAKRRASARASARRHRSSWRVAEGVLQPLPPWVWGVSCVLAVAGLFTSNPLLTPCCVITLPILATLLWFKGEPPVLLFACSMQWVQASAAVFYTNFKGDSLSVEWDIGGSAFVEATWLSLLGVLVLAIGMRLALIRRKANVAEKVEREWQSLRPGRIFIVYLIAFVVFSLLGRIAFRIPGLTQPLLATMTIKWVLIFLLAYSVLMQRRLYALLAVVVGIELFVGLLGYFSTFKHVLFLLLVVLPSVRYFFHGRRLVQFSLVAVAMVILAIVWTAIKSDYREFLNQGTGQQVVLAPVSDRVAKVGELTGALNAAKLQESWEYLILRASYVKFFGHTIDNVPANVPHEKGALWLGAIKHVFMPRLFFPDKPAIHDSERTTYYTGVLVAGAEQGTSVSIGYMGESYIDFGRVGMFAPILLLGVFYGLIYRFFVDLQPVKVLGLAMATAILTFATYTIETSNIKLVGGNVMGLLVMGTFALFGGKMLWKLITTQHQWWPVKRTSPSRRGKSERRHRAPGGRVTGVPNIAKRS